MADHALTSSTTKSTSLSRLVQLFKASGDTLRAHILRVLSQESFGVQELADIFDIPQPGMGHHLRLLAEANLLIARRHGNSIFYARSLVPGSDADSMLRGSIYRAIDQEPLGAHILQRIDHIHLQRGEQSRSYFQKNAEKFQEHQGLICAPDQYLSQMVELLNLTNLPREAKVMEVGPGQGEFLQILAKKFENITALDNSSAMLKLARSKVSTESKIRFVESSIEDMPCPRQLFDLVTINMVLHHTASPSQALEKLRTTTKLGGYLLLAELTPHEQEWARTACGDLWLGLDPQDLQVWGRQAGYSLEHSLYIGLKYGFQIQLKLFRAISN